MAEVELSETDSSVFNRWLFPDPAARIWACTLRLDHWPSGCNVICPRLFAFRRKNTVSRSPRWTAITSHHVYRLCASRLSWRQSECFLSARDSRHARPIDPIPHRNHAERRTGSRSRAGLAPADVQIHLHVVGDCPIGADRLYANSTQDRNQTIKIGRAPCR